MMSENLPRFQLTDPVTKVPRIGAKKAELFAKMGIYTLADALSTYPREYQDHTAPQEIRTLQHGERACVRAIVGTVPQFRRIRKGMDLTKVMVFDQTGTLQLLYFNNRFAAQTLHEGEEYLFFGQIQRTGNQITMLSPTQERILPGQEGAVLRYVPIYPLRAGLTQKDLLRVTDAALSAVQAEQPDFLPIFLCEKYRFPAETKAIRWRHRPSSRAEVEQAYRRMIFEELFLLCCGLQQLHNTRKTQIGIPVAGQDAEVFWNALPFAPTAAQKRVGEEILHDLQSGCAMNRLVQGDVGSGKTVLAAFLCFLVANAGMQAAIMAPTEVLARQHYKNLAPLFEQFDFRVTLLVGSLSKQEKQLRKAELAAGQVQIVIGTHALLQEDVCFQALGTVVVDEQHRFGVAQRTKLRETGDFPHLLVLSATPIPRTLALVLYGDLDLSVVDALPPGRIPVKTYAVGETMRKRIEAFIEKQLVEGGQVYVVCPNIEEGELPVKSAEEHGATLQQLLPHRRIGILHGRMRPAEKEHIMQAFVQKELDVLVATTVIEVGVDVPNATLMVIEDAERFGLSQLHQLRGRVGRGTRQSYCVCFGADKGELARKRLKLFASTGDGFEIAKADLELRGPGDLLGTRQHGFELLHTVRTPDDLKLMQAAREEAESLLSQDPALENYPLLREQMQKLFADAENKIH